MGHLFAEIISHQGQYVHLGAIFTRPYITQLIIGMGLIDHTEECISLVTALLLGYPLYLLLE